MLKSTFLLLLLFACTMEAIPGVPPVSAHPKIHSKEKPRYEVVSNPGARPGYARIQDAIEAARAGGASSTHPAIIAIEAGSYEEDLVLYDGIEIEGPDGEFLDLDCLDSPLVQIAGVHALPREGAVHLKNLILQLHPSNSESNQGEQRDQSNKTAPRSLIFPPTTRTDPALTNSGGGGSGIIANNHSVLVGAPGNAIASLPVASDGQILIGSNGVDPVWAVPTDSASIVWSTGPGTLSASFVGGGTVNSVVGTANRITVNTVANIATVDISPAYVGQTSITTLGTIGTGDWQASVISPSRGGTGIANANTITLGGNIATAGAFTTAGANALTLTTTAATNATLPAGSTTLVPTIGTGATGTWNISITGNAATVTTNANLTGDVTSVGNATTYNNIVPPAKGGTGVNNGTNTLTLAGNLATAGAFDSTFTMTNTTTVTFPTTGTLATTAQIPTFPLSLANGGTNASLTASNGGIFYSTATAGAILAGTATANQVLLSGSSSAPSWSTATYPATTTANQLLYSSATNTITGLATANNGVLITSGAGVPSVSSTLPTAVQGNITSLGTIASGVWNGTVIDPTYGGTGVNNGTNTLTLAGNLATAGAFSSVFTMTNTTTVTFPTTGTLATTSQIPAGAPLTSGNDTNVTLTLGGSPTTALVNAASITAGWTGTLATSRGGLGGATTPTSGTILTGTGTAWTATTATYPVTTTANQLLYSSAADTIAGLATANNGVLITSGAGVPSISSTLPTAVQGNIASLGTIASGVWNGTVINPTYGGTGVNNGTNTLTLAGNLATAGAFSSVFTMTNTTAVTFPTTGTLATTAQIPTLPLSLANGGTNANLTASNGGIFYSTATAGAILAGTATAGQMLRSGATAAPTWSTATFPATATGTGTILRADGTNWVATTATYPATTTANQLLYSSSANTVAGLATANNGVLQTDASGIPSISTGQTYSPTIGDGTNNFSTSTANGYFYRIGARTFVNIAIIWTSKGSASAGSILRISLPSSSASTPTRNTFTLGYVVGVTATTQLLAFNSAGDNYISFATFVSAGAPASVLVSGVNTSGEIQLSGWFGN